MEQVNFGTLVWYTKKEFQHYLKDYAFGKLAPILTELNQIPPFQLTRSTSAASITSFKLVDSGGTETTITTDITTAGLEVVAKSGFDIIKYPSNVKIPNQNFAQNAYYAVMSDGANTWYSEYFQMLEYTGRLLKIEFCHDGNFEHEGGYIDYSGGYKNRLFLDTQLSQPTYPTEQKGTTRQGRFFPEYQVSWKQYKFNAFLPEYLLDVARLIWQHDFVEIWQNGKKYAVQRFLMNDPEWQDKTDIAKVEFEFTNEAVYTAIAGRGVTSASCDIAAGECFTLTHTAVAMVENGSAEHTGHYYVNATTGNNVNFTTDDYVIVKTGSVFSLKRFNGSGYDSVSLTNDDIVYDLNGTLYYEQATTLKPNSLTVTDTAVKGRAISGSVVEVWVRLTNGQEYLITTGTAADFNTASGISYTKPNGASAIMVKIGNAVCGNYWESAWIDFGLPCPITSQGMYANEGAAITGGVSDDEYFVLSQANSYGLPNRIVMQVNPTVTYLDDTAALAALGYDTCYSVKAGNPYGLPEGIVRVLIQNTTTYADDAAAQTAGISDGDLYVWTGSGGGVSNVIKELYAAGIPA